MALTLRRIAVVLATVVALWWLRDPAWIAGYRHGITDDGWTGGRASFFVPADRDAVTFEVAGHDQFTVQVSFYVDGRLVDRFSLDDNWRAVTLPTGQFDTSRRHRRIDIHVARTWGPHRKGIRIKGL
jgi:hypothetical protein